MKKLFSVFLPLLISFFAEAQVPSINIIQMATGYSIPVDIKSCGDQRLFIVEKQGYIRILYKNGTKQTTPFLDIHTRVLSTGNEQGLLTLAFSPNYKQDGYFYVNYINGSGNGSTRISRFSVMANDSTQADPNSEVILLTFSQPEPNHNGATLMFGPDGYLYDSQGDGGGGSDMHGTYGNGQNKNTYLAKMLRLNVTEQITYTVPPTNPFVGVANTKPEIWAYGLRNPWRCSFDRITGDMWIGDVGQDAYEELDFQSVNSLGGENYGWRCREGFHACPNCNLTGCPSTGFTDPVFEMPQAGTSNCSITGGYVYRGAQYSKLFGRYFHSDYCSGRIWNTRHLPGNAFVTDTPIVYVNGVLAPPFIVNSIATFGEDDLGELYIGGQATGRIYRLVETSNCNPVAFISFNDTVEGCKPVTLTALRGDTLSYQWYNSAGVIGVATSYQYTATQSGWYKIKVSKQQAGCEAMSDSIYVNAHDTTSLSTVNTVLNTCVNSSSLDLNSNISSVGGLFSGSGVSGTDFIPLAGAIGNNAIIYSYSNQFGCHSTTAFSVTLNDTTTLTKNNLDSVFCINESSFSLNGFYNTTGGSFSGNGVANDDSTFNPESAGVGTAQIFYNYSNVNNCVSNASFNLQVEDVTLLSKNISDSAFCNNESPALLTSYISPTGGTFSGNGITGNNFDPASAPVGISTIVYQYTNNFGCQSSDSFQVRVNNCTGIAGLNENLSFHIFPNPNKGNFNLNIKVNSLQKSEIIITDADGRICFQKKQLLDPNKPIIPLDLPQLAKGVYSVHLKGEKGTTVKSLVIE